MLLVLAMHVMGLSVAMRLFGVNMPGRRSPPQARRNRAVDLAETWDWRGVDPAVRDNIIYGNPQQTSRVPRRPVDYGTTTVTQQRQQTIPRRPVDYHNAANRQPVGRNLQITGQRVGQGRLLHVAAQRETNQELDRRLRQLRNQATAGERRRRLAFDRPPLGNVEHRTALPTLSNVRADREIRQQIEDDEALAVTILLDELEIVDSEELDDAIDGEAAERHPADHQDQSEDDEGLPECVVCTNRIRGGSSFPEEHPPVCRQCEDEYVATQIRSNAGLGRCSYGCCTYTYEEVVGMACVQRDQRLREMYENMLLQRLMTRPWHCPASTCNFQGDLEHAAGENQPLMISCPQCQTISCMSCHELWRANDIEHFGLRCDEFANRKEDASLAVIQRSTQPCPQCRAPIEKNRGCQHMICAQCRHHFCWTCLRPWQGHTDFFNCNQGLARRLMRVGHH